MRNLRNIFPARAILAVLLVLFSAGSGGCVRAVAGVLGVDPGELTKMDVEKNRMVPMSDGVRLATDIYKPAGGGSYPVILTRLPYGSDNALFENLGKLFVRNGYVMVVQDTRGDEDSEGQWFPFVWEYKDGHDTVDWIAEQPFYNGKLGTWGGSYFGYTQLAAAPGSEEIDCMAPFVTSGNLFYVMYRGGAVNHVTIQGWLTGQRNAQQKKRGEEPTHQADFDGGYFNGPMRPARPVDFEETMSDPEAIAAGPEAWLDHPGDIVDLAPCNYESYYDEVSAPSLLIAGWYDLFLQPQIDDFVRFRQSGTGNAAKTRLIVGPWTHGMFTSKFEKTPLAGFQLFGSSFMDWYDYWLKGVDNGAAEEAAVKVFVMGDNVWRDEDQWPPAGVEYADFYLASGGRANTDSGDGFLATDAPGDGPSDSFVYDPRDPVPTRGGNFLGAGGFEPGIKDQGDIPQREDVLVYMTEPLEEDLTIIGPVKLVLHAASSARDTDFVAKLLDVDKRGKPMFLTGGIIRARYRGGYKDPAPIEPGRPYEYEIDLWSTANTFKKGHRVALWVTSSDFPQYDRNTNAAGEGGPDNIVVADQTVFHDRARPSRLVLPVVP